MAHSAVFQVDPDFKKAMYWWTRAANEGKVCVDGRRPERKEGGVGKDDGGGRRRKREIVCVSERDRSRIGSENAREACLERECMRVSVLTCVCVCLCVCWCVSYPFSQYALVSAL
jgi:TPR repeat protein